MRLHAARTPTFSHAPARPNAAQPRDPRTRSRPRARAGRPARPRAGPDRRRLHLRRGRPRPPGRRAPRPGGDADRDRPRPDRRRTASTASPPRRPCRALFVGADFVAGLRALRGEGIRPDMVYMDLGMSSMQIDAWERGFSYSYDAPLDMRMDPRQGFTAADLVNEWPEARIAQVLRRFGEERYARGIAREIVARRPLRTTSELVAAITGGDARRRPLRRRPPGQAHLPGAADRRQRRARPARTRRCRWPGTRCRSAAASPRSPSTRSRTGRSSSSSPPRRPAASARRSCRSASAATSPRPSCSPAAPSRPARRRSRPTRARAPPICAPRPRSPSTRVGTRGGDD